MIQGTKPAFVSLRRGSLRFALRSKRNRQSGSGLAEGGGIIDLAIARSLARFPSGYAVYPTRCHARRVQSFAWL